MTVNDAREPDGRDNNFDAIRLGMAVLVVFSHSFTLGTGQELGGAEMVSLGRLALAVFFAVSGFLIAMSWERSRGLADFMRRRFVRIIPGFVVAFALSAWVVGPLASDRPSAWFEWGAVTENLIRLVLLHHVQGDAFSGNPYPNRVNGSLWTIRYEFGCYLVVAAAGLLGILSRRWFVLATWIVVWATMVAAVKKWVDLDVGGDATFVTGHAWNWVEFGSWFLAGTTAYAFRNHIRYDWRVATVAGAGVLAPLVRQDGSHVFLWPPAVAYLTFWFAFNPRVRLQHTVKYLGGDYSYGIYLYAFPIQQMCVRWLGFASHPLLLFAISTPLSVALGVLSWRLVERPFLRRKTTAPEALPARDLVAAP